MKRIIALILSFSMIMSACGSPNSVKAVSRVTAETTSAEKTVSKESAEEVVKNVVESVQTAEETTEEDTQEETEPLKETMQQSQAGHKPDNVQESSQAQTYNDSEEMEFGQLNDPDLMRYLQDKVYDELVTDLDSSDYFVEKVDSVFVSKEYLEELAYNSEANVYFGYDLAELEEQFQGTKYVFSLSPEGDTQVYPFEGYDDTYEKAIRDVAIGSGVILMCVTVSVATGGTAPAISMIFAVSAKTGTVAALSSGTISGVASGIVTGIKTNDLDQAVKAGVSAGSKGYKWAAMTGAISGGLGEAVALHGATLNGLTMNEAAIIQKETKYPLDVIREFQNMEQYEICKKAGLTTKMIDGKTALVRKIDLDAVDEWNVKNLDRMLAGQAPIDPVTGKAYELHHIGQKVDSTLSILTQEEHRLGDSYKIWHTLSDAPGVHSQIGSAWDAQRAKFWTSYAAAAMKGLI